MGINTQHSRYFTCHFLETYEKTHKQVKYHVNRATKAIYILKAIYRSSRNAKSLSYSTKNRENRPNTGGKLMEHGAQQENEILQTS